MCKWCVLSATAPANLEPAALPCLEDKGYAHITGVEQRPLRAQEAAKAQEELAAAEFDGYSSDETVRVVMSGNQEPKSVDITEEAIASGAEVRAAGQEGAAQARPVAVNVQAAARLPAGHLSCVRSICDALAGSQQRAESRARR